MTATAPDPARLAALTALGCADRARLAIGGVPVADLAARFGTPFYAFAEPALDARVASLRQALGDRCGVLYSVKANPSLALTTRLRRHGLGAEVASHGELLLCLAAGHAAADLRFAGPGKSDAELDAAVGLGLGTCHAESASEIDSLAAAAARHQRVVGVAVRVNLPHTARGSRLRMASTGSRFGVDADQVPELLRRVAGDPHLRLAGLHAYAGTQGFDAAAFVAHANALATFADRCEQDLGLPLPELDYGGGFGLATAAGDPEFDLATAGEGLQRLVAARPDRRHWLELGRWLVGPCGVYVTRVVRKKRNGDCLQLALDGGLHHHAAACSMGSLLKRPPLLVAADALQAPASETVALGGPLCTPQDQFADAVALPPLAEGALVAVLHAGAYGLTFSPHGFLSHPTPVELLVGAGGVQVIRERGRVEDVLRGQHA